LTDSLWATYNLHARDQSMLTDQPSCCSDPLRTPGESPHRGRRMGNPGRRGLDGRWRLSLSHRPWHHMIPVGGSNLYPAQIEAVLSEHPSVADS